MKWYIYVYRSSVEDKGECIYLLISFCIAIIRICAVCFCSIRVHEKSKLPLEVLYSVPPSSYCNEVSASKLLLICQLYILVIIKFTVLGLVYDFWIFRYFAKEQNNTSSLCLGYLQLGKTSEH